MRKIIWVKEARSNSEEEVVVPKKRIIRIRSEEKVVTSKSEEKAAPEKGKCIHGKNRNGYHCKQCPGKGICEHNRRKYRCVECKGPAICIHNKQKCKCVECEGSSICIHRKIKYTCVECKGSSICQHNRRKYICVLCNGNGICEHKRVKSQCSLCHGGAICIHNNRKCRCKICKGSTICIHDRQKYRCFDCQGSSICEHQRMKSRCKDCRRALPIEESLKRYKHACVICGANLNSSTQKLNRLCSDHLTPDTKRVEVVWREIIQEEFIFPPSTIDEPVYTDACKRGKYRPDLSYHTSNLVINLELDEHCHSSYDPDCELKRLVNMKDAYPDQKLLVIRMNPDHCPSAPEELEDLRSRTYYLLEVMRIYLEDDEELDDKITNVIYLFYSNRIHIEKALSNPEQVKVIDDFFCD